jgi:hypothetical protein
MVMTFEPLTSGIEALQLVVPVAVPLLPELVDHRTCVTPMLSVAVPPTVSDDEVVEYELPLVGDVMDTVGAFEPEYVTVSESTP